MNNNNNNNNDNLNETIRILRSNDSNNSTFNIHYTYNYYNSDENQRYTLQPGDRIRAMWDRGRHYLYRGWFYGIIMGLNEENNYIVRYDDGFIDNNVPIEYIRFIRRNNSYDSNTRNDNQAGNDDSSNNQNNSESRVNNSESNRNTNQENRSLSRIYPSVYRRESVLPRIPRSVSDILGDNTLWANNIETNTNRDTLNNDNNNDSIENNNFESILTPDYSNTQEESETVYSPLLNESENDLVTFEESINNITTQLENTINNQDKIIEANTQ